jgi:hypothetical protein
LKAGAHHLAALPEPSVSVLVRFGSRCFLLMFTTGLRRLPVPLPSSLSLSLSAKGS